MVRTAAETGGSALHPHVVLVGSVRCDRSGCRGAVSDPVAKDPWVNGKVLFGQLKGTSQRDAVVQVAALAVGQSVADLLRGPYPRAWTCFVTVRRVGLVPFCRPPGGPVVRKPGRVEFMLRAKVSLAITMLPGDPLVFAAGVNEAAVAEVDPVRGLRSFDVEDPSYSARLTGFVEHPVARRKVLDLHEPGA